MQRNQCSEPYAAAYKKLAAARSDWGKLSGPMISGRKAISEAFAMAIEEAINATADFDESGAMLELSEENFEVSVLFDALAEAYREFKRRACAATSLSEVEVDGDSSFWRALNGLEEWFNAKYNYLPPSAIDVYRSQQVGDDQIARIFGWYTEDGEPDLQKVLEEEASPGLHYNPETWVHPAKRKRNELAKAAVANRKLRQREYLQEQAFKKSAPPALDELVRLGAPASQIASLHGIEVEDAEALLRNFSPPASDRAETEGSASARLQRDTEAVVESSVKSKKNKG